MEEEILRTPQKNKRLEDQFNFEKRSLEVNPLLEENKPEKQEDPKKASFKKWLILLAVFLGICFLGYFLLF